MKKLSLTLYAFSALAVTAFAGTESYSSKETAAPAACPSWFADSEFNVTLSGIYAPTTNDYADDRYLFADHGWGGALDAKYFFRRYFGVGLQGFGIGVDGSNFRARVFGERIDAVGGGLGTFTVRYPIPCTRFAPYAWAGVGAIFNGSDNNVVGDSDNAKVMGQYGGGFEVRVTPHIGWTNDVSYNQIDGGHNDFLQVRTGLNFAF